jgi:hypothetical protein
MARPATRPRARSKPQARRSVPIRGRISMRAPVRRKPSRTKSGFFAFVIGTLLFVAALPLCLVCAVGLAPAIVAGVIDRNPKRYLLRTLAILNLSGMVVPVATLLRSGLNVLGAAVVLFDPYQWLWMYGAAALGWVCYLGTPPIARIVVEGRAVKLEKDLQARAKVLVEEWGDGVTGRKAAASE